MLRSTKTSNKPEQRLNRKNNSFFKNLTGVQEIIFLAASDYSTLTNWQPSEHFWRIIGVLLKLLYILSRLLQYTNWTLLDFNTTK